MVMVIVRLLLGQMQDSVSTAPQGREYVRKAKRLAAYLNALRPLRPQILQRLAVLDLTAIAAAHPASQAVGGSMPLFRIASEARVEVRKSISRLEPSISLEPATIAAENV
jgi:hypothetical protein